MVKNRFDIFSLRMRRNGCLGAFVQKYHPEIRSGELDFLFPYIISSIGVYLLSNLAISLVRMHRNSNSSDSGLKTAVTIVFSVHDHTLTGWID